MKKKILLTALLTITSLFFIDYSVATAATYYSAPNGGGSTCGLNTPCTLNSGLGKLAPGDTLYLRGGTYRQGVYVYKSGNASNPITISGYPGENAVIDGYNTIPSGGYWGVLFNLDTGSKYVIIKDLEVKDSWGIGISISGNNCQLINIYSHGNWENGILVIGDYNTIENCRVYYNAKAHENGSFHRSQTSWAGGLNMVNGASYNTIKDCSIWNNWGEGLSSFGRGSTSTITANNTIQDNIIYDNEATNVYLQNTQNCLLQRNLIYNTGTVTSGGRRGIMIGDEYSSYLNSDNTIINNLVVACRMNLYWWHGQPNDGLKNTLIAFNTFVNSTDATGNFVIGSGGNHNNTKILNNIILQEDSKPVAAIYASSGIYWGSNNWSKNTDSDAIGIYDQVGNPKLAKSTPIGPGTLKPEYFKISVDSPARDRAAAISGVIDDFMKNLRGTDPDIGGIEYEENNSTTQPSAPTGLRVVLN